MLLIEDDAALRGEWAARLRAVGHEVTAVARAEAPPRAGFDLVLDGVSARTASLAGGLPALAERLQALAGRIGRADLAAGLDGFAGYLRLLDEPGADELRAIELPPFLDRLLALTDGEVRRHAAVVRRFDACPPVRAATRQLAQIFANLILNAAQAMPPDGAATSRIEVRTATDGDGWALVEIADNGPGIAAALREKIFEPHFTTKGAGGQGLGLPIARDLAVALGGTLSVESEVDRGSTFRVRLPPARNSTVTP